MTDDRRHAVLRAIVEDYVATKEPVGSKAIVDRHALGVSPATIRNDMAALEEDGLITAPHTSAGRVPTDMGYRVFVDGLDGVRPLSSPERRAIDRLLAESSSLDLDAVLDRTVRLLAQLTHQVAVVAYPSLSQASVRHVELVAIGPSRLVLVLITDSGRVEQRVVETPVDVSEDLLVALRARIGAVAVGQRLADAAAALERLADSTPAAGGLSPEQRGDGAAVRAVVAALVAALGPTREQRVVMTGAANLARASVSDTTFAAALGPVLEAIEEQVVMLRLLTEVVDDPASGVSVRIGREVLHAGLTETSVVTSAYGGGCDPVPRARIGVLGPTRMDYPSTIASVRAVARYLTRVLAE